MRTGHGQGGEGGGAGAILGARRLLEERARVERLEGSRFRIGG